MTPPIEELYRVVKRVVMLREAGCCFSAPSGVGKTDAVSLVAKMLRLQIRDLPVYEHDAQNQQIPSIRAFFKHFLNTVGHPELRGETYDLRNRLTNRLVDDARQCGLNMAVLLIDEAQAMSIRDFLFLKDVHNTLNRERVKLITIMMGQEPDFRAVLDELRTDRRLDLIARFAMTHLPFRAYTKLEDFVAILNGIDIATFPPESGCTWTQFFFPKAFASGFRMKNEASSFLSALKIASPATEGSYAFPARQCFLAIRTFLVDNAAYDAENMVLDKGAWGAAVQYAKLREAMMLMKIDDPDSDRHLVIQK